MDAKNFSEVFTYAGDEKHKPEPVYISGKVMHWTQFRGERERVVSVPVGPYLTFRNSGTYRPSLWVTPSKWVVDYIEAHMLIIENDSIYFELIHFPENGIYNLYAHYNLILGSRLICAIAADSVPDMEPA